MAHDRILVTQETRWEKWHRSEANPVHVVGSKSAKKTAKKESKQEARKETRHLSFPSEVERQGWEPGFGYHGNGNGSWLGLAVAVAAWELALWQRGLPAGGKTAGLPERKR